MPKRIREATPEEQQVYWDLAGMSGRRLLAAHEARGKVATEYWAAYREADEMFRTHISLCTAHGETVRFRVFNPEDLKRLIDPDLEQWDI